MNTLLTRTLITTFTRPGDVVLDPMAGVGTTLVEGMLLGRNVVGVDLEEKFCKLIEGNLENVKKLNDKSRFKLQLGRAAVIKGDSRQLAQLLEEKMDAVVTSPPYGLALNDSKCVGHGDKDGSRLIREKGLPSTYSRDKENIGNLPHEKDADAIITSPPYSGAVNKHAGGDKVRERFEGFMGESQLEARKYSEDERNIGNLGDHGKVDAVLTSPPFSESIGKKAGGKMSWCSKGETRRQLVRYSENEANLGNLKHGRVDTVITSPPFGEAHHGGGICRRIAEGKPTEADLRGALRGGFIRCRQGAISSNPENIDNIKKYGQSVDAIVTSPPYGDGKKGEVSPERKARDFEEHYVPEMGGKSFHTQQRLRGVKSLVSGYSDDPENIGNLKLGEVDAVLTSPPYANSKKGVADAEDWADRMEKHGSTVESRRERHTPGRLRAAKAMSEGYSENPDNIGNLPHEKDVSAIITSPPYSEGLGHGRGKSKRLVQEKKICLVGAGSYSKSSENIGEIRTHETYLEAMLKVYREMFKVLKPGGLAIIVLKNFIRNWKVVDLIGDTVKLCEFCGFKLVKRIRFVLPQQSFWRTNYRPKWEKKFKKSFPEEEFASVYKYETVLCFRKP